MFVKPSLGSYMRWCLIGAAVLAGFLMPSSSLAQQSAQISDAGAGVNGATPPQPPAPRTPRPPVPPVPVESPVPRKEVGYTNRNASDGTAWVLLYGDDAATMNGSMQDLQSARRYRNNSKEEILWFRWNGKAYVVRDASLLRQARELFRTETDLRARQEELGRWQSELGSRQGALGASQGELGAEMSAVSSERAKRGGGQAPDLDRRMKEISAKLDEIGRQQDELARQQGDLEKQQEAIGHEQDQESRRVERELRSLMDRAVQSRLAEPVG